MEIVKHTLTWSTFTWAGAILFILWLLTTKTQIGRNIVTRETPWSISKWSKLILVIAISLFILVNPIYHLIGVTIFGSLYYFLVSEGTIKSSLIKGSNSKSNKGLNLNLNTSKSGHYSLLCIERKSGNMIESRFMLERCLFSFPYLKDNPYPAIQYLDDQYQIDLDLTSSKYLASLMDYLRQAGFKTKSVLMLIVTGVLINLGLKTTGAADFDFFPILEVLGIVGLIMIVLEAALELKLDRDKVVPITIAFAIALVGLLASAWITALILHKFVPGMTNIQAWIYATPLSILSSAIIIPSVVHLRNDKKEFHIYESTFSDILGIMVFYFLIGQMPNGETGVQEGGGFLAFGLTTILTIVLSLVFSYGIVFVFQTIKSHTKQFLLIAVLLLLYSVGKLMHLSSLILIFLFGLVIANMDIFFKGPLKKWLDKSKAEEIYHGLHTVTLETAFVVRTFFFAIFGITIVFSSLASWDVIGISAMCLVVIYVIRFILLRATIGEDIMPQLYIAPRGLITILLYYAIPEEAKVAGFSEGILLFIIIGTSLMMTWAMIKNKARSSKAISKAEAIPVNEVRWKAPEV